MKNKTPLILMEQLAMVLVFALAAAVCLQIFVLSDQLSKKQEAKANAAFLAQNTAEWLKSQGIGFSEAPEESGWQIEDGAWVQQYDKHWQQIDGNSAMTEDASYKLKIFEEKTEIPGLVCAKITVSDAKATLFEVPVAWQEVAADE